MTKPSIFELKTDFEYLRNDILIHFKLVSQLVKHRNNELTQDWKAAMYKQMIWLASKDNAAFEAYLDFSTNEDNEMYFDFDIETMKKYVGKRYSKFNSIIALRNFWSKYKKAKKEIREAHRDTKLFLSELKQLKKTLIDMDSKTTHSLLGEIEEWRGILTEIIDYKIHHFNLVFFFEYLFLGNRTITKQEMLNLVVLDKSVDTKKYIDSLPDDIDYLTFTDATFVHKIEDNNFDWIGEIYFEDFMHLRETNPEVKKKADGMLDELLMNIPTYTATFDEFGDMESITQNKPKLKLV
ncbi:hypothetical protein [Peribacillus loiseleuriae]|uniref:hypothetical protein n=1 Tax=Peribacillus loiseleuriae TaxID=1679170 RepID=UPI003D038142